jgi:autotransporter-associated beta strand protein
MEGTLRLGASGAFPDEGGLSTEPGAVFDLAGLSETIGPVLVSAGTIVLSDPAGPAGADEAILTVNQSTDGDVAEITGHGSVIKSGAGTLRLKTAPPNTYTGWTVINAGAVDLIKPTAVTALRGLIVVNGGTLRWRVSHQIDDVGAITVNASGALDLGVYSDAIATLTGSGATTLDAGSVLTVGRTGLSMVYSGVLGGPGRLRKEGTGTLLLNGSVSQVDVIGGVLGGTGTIGTIQTDTGIVSPGANPGTGILTAGSAILGPSSTFVVALNGPTPGQDYDQLVVTGGLSLGEATLSVTLGNGYVPVPGTQFAIIDIGQGGSWTGRFINVQQGQTLTIDGQRFQFTYPRIGGRDIVLEALGPASMSMSMRGTRASTTTTRPALTWNLAGVSTGAIFDTDLLIANPTMTAAPVTLAFVKDDGSTIVEPRLIPAQSRATVHVDEIAGLEHAVTTVQITSTDGVPLVVERTTFWDATRDAGETSAAVMEPTPPVASTRWGLAEGRVGGPCRFGTIIVLDNPQATDAEVTVTYVRETGAPPIVSTYTVPAERRVSIAVHRDVPELQDEAFGAVIAVTNDVPILAERSMTWTPSGTAGVGVTHARGTRLP